MNEVSYEYVIYFISGRKESFSTPNRAGLDKLLAWFHGSDQLVYELPYNNPQKQSSKLYLLHHTIESISYTEIK